MAVSEKTRKVLQDLGLTDYEIKVYISLLGNPGSQASDISKSSDVPVSKIYEVLSNLERKGWVESQHGRPSKYFPKSPSTALQAFRMRIESELNTNEEYLLRELMPIYERKESQERPDIWIVRGEFNILAKVRESIDRCEKELLAVVPPQLNDVIDLLLPTVIRIRSLGVNVRMLLSEEINETSLRNIAAVTQLRLKGNMFGGGVICDAREVVLLLGESGGTGRALAIWSDHAGLASFAKNYFEFLWTEATPFAHV